MPVLDLANFTAALPPRGALLGLDPGAKRIGVAASDPDRLIASPLEQIARTRDTLRFRKEAAYKAAKMRTRLYEPGEDPAAAYDADFEQTKRSYFRRKPREGKNLSE